MAFCATHAAIVASVHSEVQNTAVVNLMRAAGARAGTEAYLAGHRKQAGHGAWSWDDGSPWDYISPLNDGLDSEGHSIQETKLAIHFKNRNGRVVAEWHDWQQGQATLGVICKIII
eukprot:gene25562-31243_t